MIYISNIPFPPTMNHRYIPNKGRLILSPEHRKYAALLSLHIIKKIDIDSGKNLKDQLLNAEIIYSSPKSAWFNKDGSVKKIDTDNRHKCLLDVIIKILGIDDSQIFSLVIYKQIDNSLTEKIASVKLSKI